jgi:ATP-dependent helicase/nuclease subunit A
MSERETKRPLRGSQMSLFDAGAGTPPAAPVMPAIPDPDADARIYAVDPRHNVLLEASAGTGKTTVLVTRYVNLLKAGVDPSNILAITFTRKAAAEMRERIIRELRTAAARSELDRRRWVELRDRINDIAISTIDAFCLSLLREFPLEADVDPGFDLADETEVPRLIATALDRTLRIVVARARTDADVALVLAQLGISRTREGLATLLDRRLVASDALNRFLARGPRDLTAASACQAAARALQDTLLTIPGGLTAFLADGPSLHPRYQLFVREIRQLPELTAAPDATIRAVLDRVASHFLTNEGKARKPASIIHPYKAEHYPKKEGTKRHRDAVFAIAPRVEEVMFAFNRDLNAVMARGVHQMYAIALHQYRSALEERSVLDFSDVLERSLELLRQMDEFSQSRYRLEARYHHVLVDEFQDTSRAQWELVSLLAQAWGEGLGLANNPSIFVVGDRKQSIYRFRDAEVSVLEDAAAFIDALRPGTGSRRSIARSFRAVPELLHFVNDLFTEITPSSDSAHQFRYDARDRFPVAADLPDHTSQPVLGIAVAESPEACAAVVADEVARVLRDGAVRDKTTGLARPVKPGDIGILFRSRSSHREFEHELNIRGIPTYVYKGLGFFDADEIKDLTALVRYLADPTSNLRAAAFLRSRFVRLSDAALTALAPDLAAAIVGVSSGVAAPGSALDAPDVLDVLDGLDGLDGEDRRVLDHVRAHVPGWLAAVDRITPAELIEGIIADSAYAYELAGARRRQAWENVKKMRGLIRRIQNRGYATLPRIAEHLMALTAGDESNAVIEAIDAVNLMTVHASKGLEFPVVFVVNLAKGATGPPRPVRVVVDGREEPSVTVGPFISDVDEAERERERHETIRLLYVAVTRARDRLYLASPLKDGVLVAGRGSLAEVLPDSVKGFFGRALTVFNQVDTVGWSGASGREYQWTLCRPADTPIELDSGSISREAQAGTIDDFSAPAVDAGARRMSTSDYVDAGSDSPLVLSDDEGTGSERLLGVLIHRLFEFGGRLTDLPADGMSMDRAAASAHQLLRPEELAVIHDPQAFAENAARLWLAARARADVIEALAGISRFHELPFSMLVGVDGSSTVVRGTIDCLVRRTPSAITVVELKTGRPHGRHQQQLALYVEAARALHPEDIVDGLLLYV